MRGWLALGVACAAATAAATAIEVPEQASVAVLPEAGDHWVWVPDRLLQHSLLFDGDTGKVLGVVDTGNTLTPKPPLFSRARNEIYSVDTAYSRAKRGDRIDFVSIHDARTLKVTAEILVPTMAAEANSSVAYTGLLDGDRFLGIYNQFPNQSISVVDLEARRFVEEVVLSGCAGIFPVGARRFATICGNGTVVQVDLDEEGRKASLTLSEPFFDVVADPIMLSAGRDGARWYFVSFEGQVRTVDFSGDVPQAGEPWSLVSDRERAASWRTGGLQNVALHATSGRLFVVMHQGGPGSHKDPGPEIWVYDLATHSRMARIEAPNLAVAFLGPLLGLDPAGLTGRLLEWLVPNQGVHTIAVTRDEHPLLFARNAELGVVAVLDAGSGEHLRSLGEAGIAGPTLEVP